MIGGKGLKAIGILKNSCQLLLVFVISALAVVPVFSQVKHDPKEILKMVQEQYDRIDDYSVELAISVDIPNFRMPDKKIDFYYKKPDKVSIKAFGFAMVPRIGILPSPSNFLKDGNSLKYFYSDVVKGVEFHVIGVSPAEEDKLNPDLSLWVNADRWTIDKVTSKFDESNWTDVSIYYSRIGEFWLPESTIVDMRFKRGIPRIPRPGFDPNVKEMDENSVGRGKMSVGRVLVIFSDFKINFGLDESLFNNGKAPDGNE